MVSQGNVYENLNSISHNYYLRPTSDNQIWKLLKMEFQLLTSRVLPPEPSPHPLSPPDTSTALLDPGIATRKPLPVRRYRYKKNIKSLRFHSKHTFPGVG